MNKIVHYIGLDVHKETIAVSIAPQNSTEVRRYGIIGGTLDAVDKLVKKLAQENIKLHLVYEAGPCGFVLCRHLRNKGLHCEVIAPSLIPKKASDRVKTDRRDADQLARLYRAGELTAIHVPDQEDEAIRDLVRARTSGMAEEGDFSRFDDPRSLMHFFGLTPSEHSSSDKRVQGGITRCGNAHCRRVLTEAAWHYRLKPLVSQAMQKRQEHQSKEVRLIAWKAQQRLPNRFKQLAVRKKSVVAVTAIARELVGFVWAIACKVKPAQRPPAPEI